MKKLFALTILISATVVSHAESTASAPASDAAWKNEMERKIDLLTQELEKKNMSDVQATPQAYESKFGLAPAASKVYHVNKGVSIGGYGEMLFKGPNRQKDNGTASGSKRSLDFLRAVLYAGYKFNDRIVFNSEIEFEHASTGEAAEERGEVSVESAYLDFLLHPTANIRAGLMLVPMGFTNEVHEPTAFLGSQRPAVERNIIPSTWRENGVGVFGEWGPVRYRSYLMAGLHAEGDSSFDGFSAGSAIRGGRTNGTESSVEDIAWVGRLDVTPITGTTFGFSLYTGQSGQNATNTSGDEIDGRVTLWEMHSLFQYKGLEIKGLYAQGTIQNVGDLNTLNGFTGPSNSIGERFFGGYAEVAYDILPLFGSNQYLAPFFRYERYDTQQRVASGFAKNPANSQTEYIFGISYKPIPNVVIKADYQDIDNQAGTGVNQFNAALGYIF